MIRFRSEQTLTEASLRRDESADDARPTFMSDLPLRVEEEQFVLPYEGVAEQKDVRALALVGHQYVGLRFLHGGRKAVGGPREGLHARRRQQGTARHLHEGGV